MGAMKLYSLTWVLGLLCLQINPSRTQAAGADCGLDVVLAIDGSGSISDADWNTLRGILRNLLNSLEITPSLVNLAQMVFDSEVYYSSDNFKSTRQAALQELTTSMEDQPGEGTRTDLVVTAAAQLLKDKGRDNVPNAIIVATDGDPDRPDEAAAAVRNAVQGGSLVFAVGYGGGVNENDLLSMVGGDQSRVLYAARLDNLLDSLLNITKAVCAAVVTTTPVPTTTTTTPTTTTTTTTTTTPAPPPPGKDLCSMAMRNKSANGQLSPVGFLYHPTDCDKFIQCHFYQNSTVAVYRTCPQGRYWDHHLLSCQKACDVDCPYEKCRQRGLLHHQMEGSCRAYWSCKHFKSQPSCCSHGERYMQGYGCVRDPSCTDHCGPVDGPKAKGVCEEDTERLPVVLFARQTKQPRRKSTADEDQKMKDWLKKHLEEFLFDQDQDQENEDTRHSECDHQHCDGDHFDLVTCQCAKPELTQKAQECRSETLLDFSNATRMNQTQKGHYDLRSLVTENQAFASFPGKLGSLLHLDLETYERLAFTFTFREKVAVTEKVVLLQSSRCEFEGTMVVTLLPEAVRVAAMYADGLHAETTVSTLGFSPMEWKTLTLVYDDNSLTLSVRNSKLHHVSRIDAPKVGCFRCGVDFGPGTSRTRQSFTGDLMKAGVFSCYPQSVMAKP